MTDWTSFVKCFRLLPYFARLAHRSIDRKAIFYQKSGGLNKAGVLRENYLIELCRGKRVLHFGFLDAPFCEEKITKGQLLHQQLQEVAAFLCGLDIDAQSLELYRKRTGDQINDLLDIQKPLPATEFLAKQYDVVLFPEVLEHLLHPALALGNLREICRLNGGAKLCITTPNAYSVMAFFVSVTGDELVHPDHYFYFSPATLRKLVQDTGFKMEDLQLYASPGFLTSPGLTKHGLIALCSVA
jgi:2-polyprenyl-3-methyl-5-hydroxy-6-metoxy-1,4-benzoquinol methylase